MLGRANAPFLVRLWPVWGRRAATFPHFEGVALGLRVGSSRMVRLPCQLFPAEPRSPAPVQPKPWGGSCHSSAKGFLSRLQLSSFLGLCVASRLPFQRGSVLGAG